MDVTARGRRLGMSSRRDVLLKRALDVSLASVGVALAAPLWLCVAIAIKLEDGGPILYRQQRWGRGGAPFCVFKFRSMTPQASTAPASTQAAAADPRITRVGRILRATALDELPQFLNILRGEMSFVGPRALPIDERQVNERGVALRDRDVPGFAERLVVTPGLTGIAQIYAERDIPRRHKFKYDLLYIRTRSLSLDVRLVLLSLWITAQGAWERRGRKF
jgi:lipopolysaccharide/colanic/teichoic acid biosynthesis glycosyltransferase